MCYPPGIPILAPGERITPEILDYIEYAKAKGCNMTGPEDPDILRLNVLDITVNVFEKGVQIGHTFWRGGKENGNVVFGISYTGCEA